MADRGPFWPRFWRALTHQGPPWQPDLAALRVQHFLEAADVLDSVGRKQECFDDEEMQQQARESFSCARLLRLYVGVPSDPASR
jgi:hypothetical protein